MSMLAATAAVSIMPTFKGLRAAIVKQGQVSGKSFADTFSRATSTLGSKGLSGLEAAVRKASASVSAAQAAQAKAQAASSAAADRHANALGRVRVAEDQVTAAVAGHQAVLARVTAAESAHTAAVARYGATSSQAQAAAARLEQARAQAASSAARVTAAQERLSAAQRGEAAAATATETAERRLAQATERVTEATRDLTAAQEKNRSGGFAARINTEAATMQAAVTKLGNTTSARLSTAFSGIRKAGVAAFAAVGAAAGAGLSAAVNRVDILNNYPKVMANLGFSANAARASVQKMSDALIGLPSTLQDVSLVTQRLAPLTSSLDEATNLALALNNAFLASGASTEDVSRAMTQYTQMLAKGKVDMQSWRTLQETMPAPLNQLAQALLGPTANSQALYEALSSGQVSFDQFNQAITRLNREGVAGFASFEQQARDATKGIKTAFTNLGTSAVRAKASIIQAIGADQVVATVNKVGAKVGEVGGKIADYVTHIRAAQPPTEDFTENLRELALGFAFLATSTTAGAHLDDISNALNRLNVLDPGTVGKKLEAVYKTAVPAFNNFRTNMATLFNRSLRDAAAVDGNPFAAAAVKIQQGLAQAFAPLNALGDSIRARLAGVGEKVSSAFTPLTTRLSSLDSTIRAHMTRLQDSLASGLEAARAGVAQRAGAIGDAVNTRLLAPFKTLNTKIGAALTPVSATLSDKILGPLQALQGRVSQAGATMAAGLSQAFSGVSDFGAALADRFGGPIEAAFGSTLGRVKGLVSGFFSPGNFLKFFAIGSIVAGLVAGLGAFAAQGGQQMIDDLTATLSQAPARVAEVVSSISAQADMFLQTGVSLIQALLQGIIENLPTILAGATNIITSLVTGLAQALPTLLPMAAQVIVTLVQGLVAAAPQIITAGLELLSGLVQGLTQALPILIGAIPQIIVQLVNGLLAAIPQILASGGQIILALIQGILAALPQLIAAIPQIIVGLVEAVIANLPAVIAGGINLLVALITGLIQALPQLIAMAPQIVYQLVNGLVQNWPQIKQAGIAGMRALKDGLLNAIPNVLSSVRELPGRIRDALGNVGSLLLDAGRNIVNGMINGVKSMVSRLASTVRDMASSAVNAAKNFLGIHSPSRVFHRLGVYTVEGFREGLEASYGDVERSMAAFTAGLSSNVSPAFTTSPARLGAPRPGGAGMAGPVNITINVHESANPAATANAVYAEFARKLAAVS